jgi:hypothetical protein
VNEKKEEDGNAGYAMENPRPHPHLSAIESAGWQFRHEIPPDLATALKQKLT